ncbi:HEAT repeat domain-containing protein [bacterium]|nr:HEAT repeat domain-containing protein [bacterium]
MHFDQQEAGPKLHELLSDNESVRYQAIREIAQNCQITLLPLLMKALYDHSYRVREQAIKAIEALPLDELCHTLNEYLHAHDNADNRNAALDIFRELGLRAVPFLTAGLNDPDEEVRMFIVQLLGDVADSHAVTYLFPLLKDSDANVRQAVVETLGKIGDAQAVDALLEMLDDDFWIKYAAIYALGNIGDPIVTSALVGLIDDEMLQPAVIEALGQSGDVTALPALLTQLQRGDHVCHHDIICAIMSIRSKLDHCDPRYSSTLDQVRETLEHEGLLDSILAALDEPNEKVQKNTIITLGWLKEKRAVPKLIEMLKDYNLGEYALSSIVSIGDAAVPELVENLSNPDPDMKIVLLQCLGWIENKAGLKACMALLNDKDPEVQNQAVLTMKGIIELDEVENALLALLTRAPEHVVNSIIEVLSESSSLTIESKILALLNDSDEYSRLRTIKICGRLVKAEHVDLLHHLLSDEHEDVKAETIRALFAINPASLSTHSIQMGLLDNSPAVRLAAVACCTHLEPAFLEQALLPLLEDPDPEIKSEVIRILGQLNLEHSLPALCKLFPEYDKHLKIAIIKALGGIRQRDSVVFLMGLLKNRDVDIRMNTIDALASLGDHKAIPALLLCLDDPAWNVQYAAIHALGTLGDQRCLTSLVKKLHNSEHIIKKAVIQTMCQLRATAWTNELLPLLHNDHVCHEACQALVQLGIHDFEFFTHFFQQSSTQVKCLMVDVLGSSSTHQAVLFLKAILDSEFYTVRCHAVRALARIEGKKSIPELITIQKSDPCEEVRMEIDSILKQLQIQQ